MNKSEPRDIEADVDRAMAECWKCRNLSPAEREAHKAQTLLDILAKQSRRPRLLPASAWQVPLTNRATRSRKRITND